MGYGTIRISLASHETLRRMAKTERKSMVVLLDEAVEALRRQRFLEQVNAAYADLRSDPMEWEAVQQERREWDATLADGLAVAERGASYGAGPRKKASRKRR